MNWQRYERLEAVREWLTHRRLHLVVLGLLAADIILLGAAYEPMRWWHRRTDQETRAWLAYTRELETAVQEWSRALQRLRSARAERQRLLTEQFPDESTGYTETRNFLEEVARSSGVQKREIRYRNREIDFLNLIELSMTNPVSGNYGQVRKFIQAIEASPRFLILESLQLRSTGKSGIVDVDVQLRTYFTRTQGGHG